MSLSEDDLRLIKLLFERRLLSKSMILALFPERGPSAFEKQLKELFDCGYIDRPNFQLYYHQISGKSREAIYAPLNKGLAAAGIQTKTRFDTKNKALRPWNAEHRLGINTFQLAIERAVAALNHVLLAFYYPDKAWHISISEERVWGYDAQHQEIRKPVSVKLYPDSFFGLVVNSQGRRQKVGFLEFDNGTETYEQLINKLAKYILLHDQQLLKTPQNEEVKGFRVFLVMDKEARVQGLMDQIEQAKLRKRSMFFVTTAENVDFAVKSERILKDEIWHTWEPIVDANGNHQRDDEGTLFYTRRLAKVL